jgi:hypothetical protein
MTESDLASWRRAVAAEGTRHQLMPALLEYFDDYIADGDVPDVALTKARRACEMVDVITEA